MRFPVLRTGAIAQYGLDREVARSTEIVRFMDGSEQRCRSYGAPMLRWVVRLDQLDEGELAALDDFFVQNGLTGTFSFTDPVDGSIHDNCSFEDEPQQMEWRGAGQGRVTVLIRENRT